MIKAVEILARLAEAEPTSWRVLLQVHIHPFAAALIGCDEADIEQLHTISELLLFPKPVSLLLQRQLAVLRIRRTATAEGVSDTAALVRAEAVLAPLLEQAEAFAMKWIGQDFECSSGERLPVTQLPAFWRGFLGGAEDTETVDTGRRELDHIAYGARRVLGGRGLLPDLLIVPQPSFARASEMLAVAALAVGDIVAIAALHHAVDLSRCIQLACRTGQVQVLHLAVHLGWDLDVAQCLQDAAEGEIASDTRLQLLALLRQHVPTCVGEALCVFSGNGDSQCVQTLLNTVGFDEDLLKEAVWAAAAGGHINIMNLLLEHGAGVSTEALPYCADVASLQWCREHGCSVDASFVRLAALNGPLFHLEWAASVTEVDDFLDAGVFAAAAGAGDMRVIEWLHASGCPWDSTVLRKRWMAEHWSCVVFALQHGCSVDGIPVPHICAGMPLDQMKLAVTALGSSGRGELVALPALFQAAREEAAVPAAEWLICDLGVAITAQDCEDWDSFPLGYLAATEGSARLLQHLCEKGLYTPGRADARIALTFRGFGDDAGRLKVVRWLLARGVQSGGPELGFERGFGLGPHDPAVDTPEFFAFLAARQGSLELLQALAEACGAHWMESACVAAAQGGRLQVLRWLLSQHCPCGEDTWCAAVRCGGDSNDYRPLALLHAAKRPWGEAVWAAATLNEEVQVWLKERGCPGSHAVAEGAVPA
jgi:hypothetical protein